MVMTYYLVISWDLHGGNEENHKRPYPCFMLSENNKMQRNTIIFLIAVKAVHVSGGFPAHHQEPKSVHTPWDICQA
jgi:hypothetical protein